MPDWRPELRERVAGAEIDPARAREIVEEIAQHLEDRYRDLVAAGAGPGDAAMQVLSELDAGDVLGRRLREVEPAQGAEPPVLGGGPRGFWIGFLQDVRFAVRTLFKNRLFAAVTLLSLALGIGANTSLFELLVALHLRSLPVAAPEELAIVKIRDMRWPGASPIGRGGSHPDLSNPLWERIRDQQQAFSGSFAWGEHKFNTAPSGEARWVRALMVSGDYFRVLGVEPVLGRLISAEDDRRGCGAPGAVATYGYWQRELGANPDVVGQNLFIEGRWVQVLGVAPPSFLGLEVGRTIDVVLPLCMESQAQLDLTTQFWLSMVGRLKPGWTFDGASAHLGAISKGIFTETVSPGFWPEDAEVYRQFRLAASPASTGISSLRQQYTTPLVFLIGIAGAVLLIACANLANLLLARASAREKEIAVRLALGASPARIVRQLMVESLVLASGGAALGLLLARLLSEFLIGFLGARIDLRSDWRVLAFTAGLAGLTSILFGLMPAFRASRSDLGLVLKAAAGRSTTEGRERFGLRRLLVATQVALSFVLLLAALLFTRSLRNVVNVDPGFRENGIVVVSFNPQPQVPAEQRIQFVRQLVERLRHAPGAESVSEATLVPIGNGSWDDAVWLEGGIRSQKIVSLFNRVSPGYFETLGTRLLAGRDFTDFDGHDAPRVAIVNEEFVRKLAPDTNVVGRYLRVEAGVAGGGERYEIVGVVQSTKFRNLKEGFSPIVFYPAGQDADPDPKVEGPPPIGGGTMGTNIIIRSELPMASWIEPVKRIVAELAPSLTMSFAQLGGMIHASTVPERLMATLAGFFGVLAAAMAALGLYGVVSYGVARRTREIGIRMALGADLRKVSSMVLRETLELVAIGLGAGVMLGLLSTRAAASMLYGLAPHDPLTLAMAVVLTAIVALAASILPAYRAARMDPMVALREE